MGPESLELTALKPDKAKISRRCAAHSAQRRTAQNARPCQAMPGHARPLNVDKNDRLSWLLPPEDKVEDKVEDITKSAQLIKRQLSSAQPDASAPQPPLVWLAPSHREHVGKTNSASKHVHNLHNTSKQNQQNTSASSLHFSSLSTLT